MRIVCLVLALASIPLARAGPEAGDLRATSLEEARPTRRILLRHRRHAARLTAPAYTPPTARRIAVLGAPVMPDPAPAPRATGRTPTGTLAAELARVVGESVRESRRSATATARRLALTTPASADAGVHPPCRGCGTPTLEPYALYCTACRTRLSSNAVELR